MQTELFINNNLSNNLMLNITFSSILMSISTIPELIALVLCIVNFLQRGHLHQLYMACTWFFLWIGNSLLAIGYLTLNLIVYRIGLLITIPLALFIILLVDSISRESIEPIKLSLVMIISTLAFTFGLEKNVVTLKYSKIGELGPAVIGKLNFALAGVFIFATSFWFYYFLMVFIKSPPSLKKISFVTLLGATFAGPLAAISYASGLVWLLPGTDYFLIALGSLLSAYSFHKEPKLGYVLPFKVSRLLLIDVNTGLPVYAHTWDDSGLSDSYLFSGALHGITTILRESLNRGKVKEIVLEQATLIINIAENYPVAFVLITSKTSAILKKSLDLFAESTKKLLPKEKVAQAATFQNLDLKEAIEDAFPYVVSYKN